MTRRDTTEIYMIKKSTEGSFVSFRRGPTMVFGPGMQLAVVNEDGFRVESWSAGEHRNRKRSAGLGESGSSWAAW